MNETKQEYTAAILGCGRIGSLLELDPLREKPCTHTGCFHYHPRIRIIAACDIQKQRLEQFQTMWGITNLYKDFETMLKEHSPDILSIATPTEHHVSHAMLALTYNIPVILLEKPVGNSLDAVQSLLRKKNQTESMIVINHERRFSSDYRMAHQLIKQGRIGEIRQVIGQIMVGKGNADHHFLKSGGGTMMHDGTHLVDIIRFLLDCEYTYAYAILDPSAVKQGYENHCIGFLENNRNIPCMVQAGGPHRYFHFQVDIQGSLGKIVLGNGFRTIYLREESKLYQGFYDLQQHPFPPIQEKNMFITLIEEMVQYLDSKNSGSTFPIVSTLEDGIKTMEAIFALYQSGITKKRISLPVQLNHHPFDQNNG